MLKELSWRNKFVYDDPALMRLLAAGSIHAFHGMLRVRFSAQSGTSKPSASRKRAPTATDVEPLRQEVLVVIDSDLAGVGTVRMIAQGFSQHDHVMNQAYGSAINNSVDLFLSTWKDKNEYYSVASSMKTSYTAATIGSYEEISKYAGMKFLLGPVKRQTIASLSSFSLKRALSSRKQSSKVHDWDEKHPIHCVGIQIDGITQPASTSPNHGALPIRCVRKDWHYGWERAGAKSTSDLIFYQEIWINSGWMGHKSSWRFAKSWVWLRNSKILQDELKVLKDNNVGLWTSWDTGWESQVCSQRNKNSLGRILAFVGQTCKRLPSEEDGVMEPETLAALKHGRYIFNGMTYSEVLWQVSKWGLHGISIVHSGEDGEYQKVIQHQDDSKPSESS